MHSTQAMRSWLEVGLPLRDDKATTSSVSDGDGTGSGAVTDVDLPTTAAAATGAHVSHGEWDRQAQLREVRCLALHVCIYKLVV